MYSRSNFYTPLEIQSSNFSLKMFSLLSQAFKRAKDRFTTYFGALLSGLVILISVNVLLLGIVFILSSLPNVPVLNTINFFFRAIIVVILIPLNFYLMAWFFLVLTQVLIQDPKRTFVETLKTTRPLIGGFIRYIFGYLLFMVFLIPLELIIYSFTHIGLISILWLFWSSFAVFIYLKKKEKGLKNLWLSYNTINQKFWSVAWRKLIVWFIESLLFLICGLGTFFLIQKILPTNNGNVGFASITTTFGALTLTFLLISIISLFTRPFTVSFNYELYKNLPEPQAVRKPKEWFWAVGAGIILSVVLFSFFPKQSNLFILNYFNKNNLNNTQPKVLQSQMPKNFKQIFKPYENTKYNYKLAYSSIYFVDGKKVDAITVENKDKSRVDLKDSNYKSQHDLHKLGLGFPFVSIKILSKDALESVSKESLFSEFDKQKKDILFSISVGSSKPIESDTEMIASRNTWTRLPNTIVGGEKAMVFENNHSWLQASIENINERIVFIEKNDLIYELECLYLSGNELKNFESMLSTFQFINSLPENLTASSSSTLMISPASCPYNDCEQIKSNLGKGCTSQDYLSKCR